MTIFYMINCSFQSNQKPYNNKFTNFKRDNMDHISNYLIQEFKWLYNISFTNFSFQEAYITPSLSISPARILVAI